MDDPEYEVTDVRSPTLPSAVPERTQPAPPSTLLSRRWHLALAAGSILIALMVIVSVWLPLRTQPHPSTTFLPSPTFPATATPVVAPTPLPITSALASPPTHCPSAPLLTTVTVAPFDGFYGGPVQLTGHAPVWIITAYLPPRVVEFPEPTLPSSATPQWPFIQIIWAIGPNSHPTVTVQVHDLQSSTLAWWGADGESGPHMPILMLNPPADIPATQSYVATAPWLLFITRAGCYKMDVTWPGGSWSLIFAAGGVPA